MTRPAAPTQVLSSRWPGAPARDGQPLALQVSEALPPCSLSLHLKTGGSASWLCLLIAECDQGSHLQTGDPGAAAARGMPRDAERDALMLQAAATARRAWASAGNWMHLERAEVRLALCHAAAGNSAAAVIHAGLCVAGSALTGNRHSEGARNSKAGKRRPCILLVTKPAARARRHIT